MPDRTMQHELSAIQREADSLNSRADQSLPGMDMIAPHLEERRFLQVVDCVSSVSTESIPNAVR